jgi:aerotaxis receptor
MGDLGGAVENMAVTMAEITVASNEQSGGIEQLNQAVNAIDETTQQNAALVEQAAAAAENLRDQSIKLSQAMSVFKITHGGPRRLLRPQRSAPHTRRKQRWHWPGKRCGVAAHVRLHRFTRHCISLPVAQVPASLHGWRACL